MKIGFHTDSFAAAFWTFERCLQWAQENDVHCVESGFIDGTCWLHGLGYWPHLASIEDPAVVRQKLEKYDVELSQIDAAYPLSGNNGMTFGVPYVLRTIQWAKLVGCPRVCTTDGLFRPEGLEDDEAMELMKRSYEILVKSAEANDMILSIEIHGYFTTKPDRLEQMLHFVESPNLKLNLDTGNSFIAGENPVDFANRFADRVTHVHLKDVTPMLADEARGKDTGIALSQSPIGQGVNADNIRETLRILHRRGFNGPIGLECAGGNVIMESLAWVRKTLKELGVPEER